MRINRFLRITLPHDMAQMIRDKLAAGEPASASEVIPNGLKALQAHDAAVERWLREDVVESCREMAADPSLGISAGEVIGRIKARVATGRA
jgi:antitoxin ParD1/3/4